MGKIIPFPLKGRTRTPLGKHSPKKPFTILVVEDHDSLRDIVSVYLMRQGYRIRTASNGQAALEILSTEEVQLVLLDLMLPWVDGFQVLHWLRQQREERSPYVIVVSALTAEEDRKKVHELGGDEYLSKPFHLPHLLERIEALERRLRWEQ
jgi:DNA-binding response OmpR family regulator